MLTKFEAHNLSAGTYLRDVFMWRVERLLGYASQSTGGKLRFCQPGLGNWLHDLQLRRDGEKKRPKVSCVEYWGRRTIGGSGE